MNPFVKWPGGKSEELEIIHRYEPSDIDNYIEPFLGGGACFLSYDGKGYRNAYLNDYSSQLISLYRMLRENNAVFNTYLDEIWNYWTFAGTFSSNEYAVLRQIYVQYKTDEIDDMQLKLVINEFVDARRDILLEAISDSIKFDQERLILEYRKSILSKLKNIKKNELKNGELPEKDFSDNFESGVRASVYTYYRYLFNNIEKLEINEELATALFYYIREFCYSSMFRYNRNGEFNVPYGGLSYNNKNFIGKVEYAKSIKIRNVLNTADIYCMDFEQFLKQIPITANDFMFLDPPYDSDFSTYANNSFDQEDQRRLANYLINECPCRFMLVIKNTDFISELYQDKQGINVIRFDKDYRVSFMDRNEKEVKHLLITNYEISEKKVVLNKSEL